MNHHITCKACRKPVVVESHEECPQSWVASLLPLVTCNRCMDRKEERDKAFELIGGVCGTLSIRQATRKPLTQEERIDYRRVLENAVMKYARWLAGYFQGSEVIWDEEVIETMLAEPGKWEAILREYKRIAMQEYRRRRDEKAQAQGELVSA